MTIPARNDGSSMGSDDGPTPEANANSDEVSACGELTSTNDLNSPRAQRIAGLSAPTPATSLVDPTIVDPMIVDPTIVDPTIARSADSWRTDVAASLERYRTRRKPRSPRYPSLLLPFDGFETWSRTAPLPNFEPTLMPIPVQPVGSGECVSGNAGSRTDLRSVEVGSAEVGSLSTAQSEAPPNLIEFPRSAAIPIFRARELADPIFERPRIVEAPEILPPPPALGGMLLEPAPNPWAHLPAAASIPLGSASILRRIMAAAVDALILGSALAAFVAIFLAINPMLIDRVLIGQNLIGHNLIGQSTTMVRLAKLGLGGARVPRVAASVPAYLPILATAFAQVAILLWMAYEFLFIVYTGSTPGLRAARLRVTKFDGSPVSGRLRRWRVLASFLSAFSAGLGYLWCLLDQQGLCWHDRITKTRLQSRPK